MQIPVAENLSEIAPMLASIVAKTSWLPHPEVVKELKEAIFPTTRYKSNHPRHSLIMEEGSEVGMYDDNCTPTWALLWSHEIRGGTKKGWTTAHVWPASSDITSYTHLANLTLVPEPFASMTDKNGPLVAYLRWHSWQIYGWKPKGENELTKPDGYDKIVWRYFPVVKNPREAIRLRFKDHDNQTTRILGPIMKRFHML